VEGVVEGGLAEGLFHNEIEVVGRARGIGLEGTFETIAAAAEGEEQEGGEEDEEMFHIVGIFWAAIDGCDGNTGRDVKRGRGAQGESGTGMLEEGEVDGAVGAELLEEGMGGEVGGLAVFEDEDAIGGEPARLEDEVGELVEIGEVVGRVGED
jgi:hypothetical protein